MTLLGLKKVGLIKAGELKFDVDQLHQADDTTINSTLLFSGMGYKQSNETTSEDGLQDTPVYFMANAIITKIIIRFISNTAVNPTDIYIRKGTSRTTMTDHAFVGTVSAGSTTTLTFNPNTFCSKNNWYGLRWNYTGAGSLNVNVMFEIKWK